MHKCLPTTKKFRETLDFEKFPLPCVSNRLTPAVCTTFSPKVYRLGLRLPSMPLPDSGNTQGIVSLYDVTEDWVPIYDKSSLPGFYMAIGTSGNQFKMAPVVGKLMRAIIEAGPRDIDVEPLLLPLERVGGTINSATFSRLRKKLETTGTVVG